MRFKTLFWVVLHTNAAIGMEQDIKITIPLSFVDLCSITQLKCVYSYLPQLELGWILNVLYDESCSLIKTVEEI